MAGCIRSAKGSLPKRSLKAAQPATAPGTVTASMPRLGGAAWSPCRRAKYSGVQALGARPAAFRPWSWRPSQTMANASLPKPLLTGSTMVMAAAAAIAASTALPPASNMRRPACAPAGWEVDTTLRANSGKRVLV